MKTICNALATFLILCSCLSLMSCGAAYEPTDQGDVVSLKTTDHGELELDELAPLIEELKRINAEERTYDGRIMGNLRVIHQLSQLGPKAKKAVPVIIKLLKDEQIHDDLHFLKVLKQINGEDALHAYYTAIADRLKTHESVKTRRRTAELLRVPWVDSDDVFEALTYAFVHDSETIVRTEAAYSLGNIYERYHKNWNASRIDGLREIFVNLLNDEQWEVRQRAAQRLRDMGIHAAPAVRTLVITANDPHRWVRSDALEALLAIGPDSTHANATLVKLLNDKEESKRKTAAWVLAKLHPDGESFVSVLHRALDDSSPGVRGNAAHALGNYGRDAKSASKKLVDCLLDENAKVRIEAAMALTKIGPDDRAVANLSQNLRHESVSGTDDELAKLQISVIDCLAAIGQSGKTAAIEELRDREELTLNSIAALSIASELPNLKQLQTKTTDEGLTHIGRAINLRSLNLDRSEITDSGFAHLSKLRQLEEISFAATPATGVGFEHFEEVNVLKRITATSNVTDDGLRAIARFPNLQYVRFSGHRITPGGPKYLLKLKKLEELNMSHSAVNDKGMMFIGQITSLRRLNISMSNVTDTGLESLGGLKNLEYLTVDPPDYNRGMTWRGVERFRSQMPNVKEIVRD